MDSDRNHSASSEIKKVKPNKRGVIIAIVTAVAIIPIVLILLNFSKKNQPKPIILDQQKDSVSIKIVFSGDLMGHMPWINSGLKTAGLKACLWSPLNSGIFHKYQ